VVRTPQCRTLLEGYRGRARPAMPPENSALRSPQASIRKAIAAPEYVRRGGLPTRTIQFSPSCPGCGPVAEGSRVETGGIPERGAATNPWIENDRRPSECNKK
jgi:hypothetical protein